MRNTVNCLISPLGAGFTTSAADHILNIIKPRLCKSLAKCSPIKAEVKYAGIVVMKLTIVQSPNQQCTDIQRVP